MVETDGILESLLFEWENFNSIASKSEPSQPIKRPRSMVMIRDSLPQSDLSIFPPINHENLRYQIQQQQQNPVSEPSLLPPSGAGDVIQSSGDHGFGVWLGTLLQIVRAKIVTLACYFGYENGTIGRAFRSFRGIADMALLVLLWWLCKRIRRRRCGEESVERLKTIIKEKDEKIVGLLNQVAQMNASMGSKS
ncbi:hypothetical protein J1N35_026900 [Gossypium stocksii]|uniref:Uncharacterized protein n=1 Tax=Gossypium stocksii TaxID=47602 RepID=A0A9D3V951_9ROSI|nr:hypothetical protein J1N35_026900 [Gossypium stocksii]